MRKIMYKIHKWIGIIVGIFMLNWIITGLVFYLPIYHPVEYDEQSMSVKEVQGIGLNPEIAVSNFKKSRKNFMEIQSITLKRIGDSLVYDLRAKEEIPYLIDAKTDERFIISKEIAEQIAKEVFPKNANILSTDLINKHDLSYPWGPLPVFRVTLEDNDGKVLYIRKNDGKVQRINNKWSKLINISDTLHSLYFLIPITKKEYVRNFIVYILATAALIDVLIGYYLWLSKRNRE
jgi:hypothetical protein